MAKNNNPLGLDPKKMHVESVDKNFTTLRHKDGHQIRIAHNVLSPESRKALAAFGKSSTESMTPVQAQQAQESNKANTTYAQGGSVRNTMPRGMTYADGGETSASPQQTAQPQESQELQQARAKMRDQASSYQAYGTMPSAAELANRLKNWWAEGGEVEPHNMPDNVTGYAEGGETKKPESKDIEKRDKEASIDKSQPQIEDGQIPSSDGTIPLVKLEFAKGGKIDDESDLVHYSRQSGLKSLDPEKMGTSGVRGAQYKRGIPENKSTFYYTKKSEPESEVISGARAKYTTKLGPEHKVYDLNKDPDKAMEHVRKSNQGAFNEDMLHAHLKSKGYHGVKWEQSPGTKVVQMYGPMNVNEEKMCGGMMAKGGKVRHYAEGTPDIGGISDITGQEPNTAKAPIQFSSQEPMPETDEYGNPIGAPRGRLGINEEFFTAPRPQLDRFGRPIQPNGPSPEAVVAAQARMNSNDAHQKADVADATANAAEGQYTARGGIEAPAGMTQEQIDNAPAVDDRQAPQGGVPATIGSFGLGREQQAAGMKQQAEAEAQIGEENVGILDKRIQAQQTAMDTYNQHFQNLMQERQGIMNDLHEQHISPDAFWSGTKDENGNIVGGHSKMMSALGMIIGGGATADFLNHQMNMDLQGQIAEAGKRQNLLQANIQQFGNVHQALMATNIMQKDLIAQEMQKAINKEAAPLKKAQLMQQLGQLNQSTAMQAWKFSLMDSMKHLNGQAPDAQAEMVNHARIVDPEGLGKLLSDSYVPGVGISSSYSPIPQQDKSRIAEYRNVFRMLDEATNFKQDNPNAAWSIQDRAKASTLMQNLGNEIRVAADMGVFKQSEAAMMNSMLGKNPAGFLSAWHTDPKLQEFKKLKQLEYKNLLDSYNLPSPVIAEPRSSQQQSNEGKTIFNKSTGQRMIMRGGKWEPMK